MVKGLEVPWHRCDGICVDREPGRYDPVDVLRRARLPVELEGS